MREMGTKFLITTEFPTPEEIAAAQNIPPKRVAELRQWIAETRERERKRRDRARRMKQVAKKKK
jgi:hypothetical protein